MTAAAIPRPAAAEYDPYYGRYIGKVPDGDLLRTLQDQARDTQALLAGLSEAKALHRYAPGKWSIKEVIGHVTDAERVFSYRALRFARADTRAALRFFAERRVKTHFVDLNERAASRGELRRFAQKFGVRALIDRDAKRFAELGLGTALLSEDRWLEKLTLEPLLLRMPLVRHQQQLTVGPAEDTWRAWVAAGKQSA